VSIDDSYREQESNIIFPGPKLPIGTYLIPELVVSIFIQQAELDKLNNIYCISGKIILNPFEMLIYCDKYVKHC